MFWGRESQRKSRTCSGTKARKQPFNFSFWPIGCEEQMKGTWDSKQENKKERGKVKIK